MTAIRSVSDKDVDRRVAIDTGPSRRMILARLLGLSAIVVGCRPAVASPDTPVTVTDHGARGMPGIDDTAAFSRAMTLAAASRRGIYIPEGRYEVSRVTILPGVAAVEGPGWLVARSGREQAVLVVAGSPAAPVAGIRISVNVDAAGIAQRGLFCTGLVDSQIVDCRVVNLTRNDGDGIRVNYPASSGNLIARNQVLLGEAGHGTHPDGLRGIHIVGETASPSGGIDRAGVPVEVANSVTGHRVEGNQVTGGTHGIAFFGSRQNTVVDNECRGQSARNIIASPSVEQIEIARNRCIDAGSSGIHVADGGRAIAIHNNVVTSIVSALSDDDDAAIQVYVGCRDVAIRDNQVAGDWRYGIALALVEGVVVTGNRLVGPFRQASIAIENDYAGTQVPTGAPFARARTMPWRNILKTGSITLADNDYGAAPIAIGIAQYGGRALEGVTVRGGRFADADRPLAIYADRGGAITGLSIDDPAVLRDPRNMITGLTIRPR